MDEVLHDLLRMANHDVIADDTALEAIAYGESPKQAARRELKKRNPNIELPEESE